MTEEEEEPPNTSAKDFQNDDEDDELHLTCQYSSSIDDMMDYVDECSGK